MGEGLRNFLILSGLTLALLSAPKFAHAKKGDIEKIRSHKWRETAKCGNENIKMVTWEFCRDGFLQKNFIDYSGRIGSLSGVFYRINEEKNEIFSNLWGRKKFCDDPDYPPECYASYFFKGETLMIPDKNQKLVPLDNEKSYVKMQTKQIEGQKPKQPGKNIGDVVNETYSNIKKNIKKTIENLFSLVTKGNFDLPSDIEGKVKDRLSSGLQHYGIGYFVMYITPVEADNGTVYVINPRNPKLEKDKLIYPMYIRPVNEFKVYWYTLIVDIKKDKIIGMKRDSVGKW